MTDVLKIVQATKPREKSGAQTTARYGYQINASILKILDLHEAGGDYRAAFDHFDDLMIFDKSDDPDRVSFYQIKTKANGVVTIKEVARSHGTGPRPRSFLGKLNHHMRNFADVVNRLGFISNLSFDFTLADGSKSKPDHHVIRAGDLHVSEVALIKTKIARDCESATPDGSDFLIFERSFLPLENQDLHVKGRLLEYFEEYVDGSLHVPIISIYNLLFNSAFVKTGITQEFTTLAEFYDRKTFCRRDIDAMFAKAVASRRFHDYWPSIQTELTASGMRVREVVALQNESIRYTSARSAGEPGALSFDSAAKSAITANRATVDACASILDLVALLAHWVTDDYDHRQGGLYVEAFEAYA